jgi:hypothetical protein
MVTNKHRKKKHLKRNLKKNKTHKTHKIHKRHYRKRRFKNSLREYLVSDNLVNEGEKPEIISVAPESGNMIRGLRDMLSATNNDNKKK